MKMINAEDVKEDMELRMWFGIHTVLRIDAYDGTEKSVLNYLIFDNGFKMLNIKDKQYKLSRNNTVV